MRNAGLAVLLLGVSICAAQQASVPPAKAAEAKTVQISAAAQQALTLERETKYTEAQTAWQSVIKAEPRNAQAYAHLGLIEARQEHYTEAIQAYKKAKALNPAISGLDLNLGLALFKSGSFQDAGKVFDAELRKRPNGPDTQKLTTLLAMSHYGAREYGAAIPYFKDAIVADPKNLTLLLALAHCQLWTKQLNAVMDTYKQILMINPDSAEADMIAGEALDEKGDNAAAVRQFQAAELANPKEPQVHFGLGYLYYTQQRYEDAIAEFKKEIENDPQNYQAMVYLGDTYTRVNKLDEAKTVLIAASPYEQPEPLLHQNLGIIYAEAGDKDAAIKEFNKTTALEPDNVTAHFRLGGLYRSMGRKDEAKAEFAKASSLNKKSDKGLMDRITAANARPPRETDKQDEPQKPDAAKPDQP